MDQSIFVHISIASSSLLASALLYGVKLHRANTAMTRQLQELSGQKTAFETRLEMTENASRALERSLGSKDIELKDIRAFAIAKEKENSFLTAELQAQKEAALKAKEDFEEQSQKLELKLEQIMLNTLDAKIKKFDDTSITGLKSVLEPFSHNIDNFKKKIEEQQQQNIEKFIGLSKEIEHVSKIGIEMNEEARNLATALKGKKQTQGSWGEMILESVLEQSGLLKGEHYSTQDSYRDHANSVKRPDVVVKLPQGRYIIIDSKVSLNDYDAYVRAENEHEALHALKSVASAFKKHIETLSAKDYTEYRTGTFHNVFMFVPVEGAFAAAVKEDPGVYDYARRHNITLVNPSTLIITLRTIYYYWQHDKANEHALKLFDDAGKLYDKMYGFAATFEKIGTQLSTVQKTFDDGKRKLTEGAGNILGRVHNLKALGAKTAKNLKDATEFQEIAELDNDSAEVIAIENK